MPIWEIFLCFHAITYQGRVKGGGLLLRLCSREHLWKVSALAAPTTCCLCPYSFHCPAICLSVVGPPLVTSAPWPMPLWLFLWPWHSCWSRPVGAVWHDWAPPEAFSPEELSSGFIVLLQLFLWRGRAWFPVLMLLIHLVMGCSFCSTIPGTPLLNF